MHTCPALVLLIETICTIIYYVTLGLGARYLNCNCIIGGDFNVDLDSVNAFPTTVNNLIFNRVLARCDLTFPTATKYTCIMMLLTVRGLLNIV